MGKRWKIYVVLITKLPRERGTHNNTADVGGSRKVSLARLAPRRGNAWEDTTVRFFTTISVEELLWKTILYLLLLKLTIFAVIDLGEMSVSAVIWCWEVVDGGCRGKEKKTGTKLWVSSRPGWSARASHN